MQLFSFLLQQHESGEQFRVSTLVHEVGTGRTTQAERGNRMYHCACLGQPSSAELLLGGYPDTTKQLAKEQPRAGGVPRAGAALPWRGD